MIGEVQESKNDSSQNRNSSEDIGESSDVASMNRELSKQVKGIQTILADFDQEMMMQQSSVEYLNQLVNDILDLARMERNNFNFDGEFLNLFALIHLSFDILQLQSK